MNPDAAQRPFNGRPQGYGYNSNNDYGYQQPYRHPHHQGRCTPYCYNQPHEPPPAPWYGDDTLYEASHTSTLVDNSRRGATSKYPTPDPIPEKVQPTATVEAGATGSASRGQRFSATANVVTQPLENVGSSRMYETPPPRKSYESDTESDCSDGSTYLGRNQRPVTPRSTDDETVRTEAPTKHQGRQKRKRISGDPHDSTAKRKTNSNKLSDKKEPRSVRVLRFFTT